MHDGAESPVRLLRKSRGNAEWGMRNAELWWESGPLLGLPIQFRIPHSALRIHMT